MRFEGSIHLDGTEPMKAGATLREGFVDIGHENVCVMSKSPAQLRRIAEAFNEAARTLERTQHLEAQSKRAVR